MLSIDITPRQLAHRLGWEDGCIVLEARRMCSGSSFPILSNLAIGFTDHGREPQRDVFHFESWQAPSAIAYRMTRLIGHPSISYGLEGCFPRTDGSREGGHIG